jgi:transposase-like protein
MEDERKRSRANHAVERRMAKRARVLREQAAERALPVLQATAAAGPLHAVLDAARTPRILEVLREAVEEHRSLYAGVQGTALEDVAPYLVPLSPGSRLLAQLVREGWGLRWGIFLEGDVPERELRRHLRRYLKVENDRGEPLYFRYYDPGALRPLWPALTRRQHDDLLGPLQAYLVEGERGEVVRLTAAGKVEPIETTTASG